MNNLRKVSVRELQHNLSSYLELAQITPFLVTKHGEGSVIVANPDKFKLTEIKHKRKPLDNIMSHPFIGMHKNRKDWKGKSAAKIAEELRIKAWYGK